MTEATVVVTTTFDGQVRMRKPGDPKNCFFAFGPSVDEYKIAALKMWIEAIESGEKMAVEYKT